MPNNNLFASNKVACRVAKCENPRSFVELILPAALNLLNIMVGEFARRLLSKLPLYNNTISRKSNAWPKTSKISNQEHGREVIRVSRSDEQLQECPFDFYTIFVDADQICEDLLFCRSVTAGVKTQD